MQDFRVTVSLAYLLARLPAALRYGGSQARIKRVVLCGSTEYDLDESAFDISRPWKDGTLVVAPVFPDTGRRDPLRESGHEVLLATIKNRWWRPRLCFLHWRVIVRTEGDTMYLDIADEEDAWF
jgi:hypothetical protein